MPSKFLDLSIDEFLRSPQDLVFLHQRGSSHGSVDRESDGYDVRRAIQDVLQERSLGGSLRLAIGDLTVRLSLRDFYHHEGALCRLAFLNEDHIETRRSLAFPPELALLHVGGWLASRYYSTPPDELRLYYYFLRGSGVDADLCQMWYRKFPLSAPSVVYNEVVERMWRLHDAFAKWKERQV